MDYCALRKHCCFYVLLSLYDEVRRGQIRFEMMTYLSDAALHCKERIPGNSIVKDYEIWNGIETMTHLSDTALPFRIHLVICPLKQSKLRKKHVFRSVQLPVLPDLESSTELPAKGQVGPDPPCPFYFFDQASCARNQSVWVVLKPQTNQNESISRKTSFLHKNCHLSSSRKFSFATSAWLRAAMLLERAKSQSQQSCENITLWKRWHLFRDKHTYFINSSVSISCAEAKSRGEALA